jgi:hypothetical protein
VAVAVVWGAMCEADGMRCEAAEFDSPNLKHGGVQPFLYMVWAW